MCLQCSSWPNDETQHYNHDTIKIDSRLCWTSNSTTSKILTFLKWLIHKLWLINYESLSMTNFSLFLWKFIVSNRKRNIFLENPIWEQIWIRLWGHLGTDVLEVQPNNHKKLETSSKNHPKFLFNFQTLKWLPADNRPRTRV